MLATPLRLPDEILEQVLSTVAVLESCFPQDELAVSSSSQHALGLLRNNSYDRLQTDSLRFILTLIVEEDPAFPLEIEIALPLASDVLPDPLVLRPPSWLSRSRYTQLVESLPPTSSGGGDDVEAALASVLDHVLAWSDHLLETAPSFLPAVEVSSSIPEEEVGPMDRVWFWLCVPISTSSLSDADADLLLLR